MRQCCVGREGCEPLMPARNTAAKLTPAAETAGVPLATKALALQAFGPTDTALKSSS